MKTSKVLERAKAYLVDPDHWCQGEPVQGERVDAEGAIDVVCFSPKNRKRAMDLLNASALDLYGHFPYEVNDGICADCTLITYFEDETPFVAVHRIYNLAIERAKRDEARRTVSSKP